ncbi:MAG: hypothetical protein A3K09_04375 [Nitrospinae bacterium RIFCSPLOWO2_12_FULL_47_7]|nr:MAG: hypothetical protein A3K09_04375 [Nitrospinae bacterium RIFCSPLOWO2_12_FULL_47_7]
MKLKLILMAVSLLSGCGYHLAGTENNLPSHLKTIVIPMFANVSPEPGIQANLTTSIRESFINDGRLKVVSENTADMLMKGLIFQYELRAVAFDRRDVAVEYWVILGVDIEVVDQVKKKTYLKQKVNTKWDYKASLDAAGSEASRQIALTQAYRDLANRLLSIVVEKF